MCVTRSRQHLIMLRKIIFYRRMFYSNLFLRDIFYVFYCITLIKTFYLEQFFGRLMLLMIMFGHYLKTM